jgi:hypothetical protein
MMKLYSLLVVLFAFAFSVKAQKLEYEQGRLLVQLKDKDKLKAVAADLSRLDGQYTGFAFEECLSKSLNIWKVRYDHTRINTSLLLEFLYKHPSVVSASYNHLLESRATVPNDPEFSRQWPFLNTGQGGGLVGEDLDMDKAWDLTTGGISATGDTIVVCVIDDGLDVLHRDFEGNIWKNYAEIPDNGLDDDGNGYVDDFRGWNTAMDNDQISDKNQHGTPVAGVIGARGDNGLGVTGINWQVKLMIVAANNLLNTVTEAELLQAYDYVLETRKLYNASGGAKGAFVVAANSSWGSSRNFPSDAPFWCALFDALGEEGVISVSATANENTNVETEGDLPSLCTSDYLMVVTNVNRFGQKVEKAAYGAYSVDLGAYGQEVYTTANLDAYSNFSGTSFAAPQVAGAIALLYAAPCNNLSLIAKSDPAAAAMQAKSYILNGVVANAALEDKTLTGGVLNVYNSLRLLTDNCQDCVPVTGVAAGEVTVNSASISWVNHLDHTTTDLRWRAVGDSVWNLVSGLSGSYRLDGLMACTGYEVQLRPFCGDSSPGFSASLVFTSDGCCKAPEFINVAPGFVSESRAFVSWPAVTAALGYVLRYRAFGAQSWDSLGLTTNQYYLSGLDPCMVYELEVETLCAGETALPSERVSFRTLGCGACLEANYCAPSNMDASVEWIAGVKIGSLAQYSAGNGGYGDFTGATASTGLDRGITYEIELTPGFSGSVGFSEYFRVWIDFNQNGLFTSSELVWQSAAASRDLQKGSFTIPVTAITGATRMRIGMFSQPGIGPCNFSSVVFGEYEDYCVEIKDTSTSVEDNLHDFPVTYGPNPVSDVLQLQVGRVAEPLWLEIWDVKGNRHGKSLQIEPGLGSTFSLDCTDLPAGIYWIRLQGRQSGTMAFRIAVMR